MSCALTLVGLATLGGCAAESVADAGFDAVGGISDGASATDASDDDEPAAQDRLDVGDGAGDPSGSAGCDKVDFLFVIDSSKSMRDEHENLLQSFPRFLESIEDTLSFDDFHLMVVDAGEVPGTGCTGKLGAGRIRNGDGIMCGVDGNGRFATSEQESLDEAFACMGDRGLSGSGDEETMHATLTALGPMSAPAGCNVGFLRDDAVLVVTIITDEEDGGGSDDLTAPPLDGTCVGADADTNSDGEPSEWFEAVMAAKGGDPDAVVVLSLIGDCDVGGSCSGIHQDPANPNAPITGAEPAPRIRAFTDMFEHGSVGPVCAPDYLPFFEAAVGEIKDACDDFIPPG